MTIPKDLNITWFAAIATLLLATSCWTHSDFEEGTAAMCGYLIAGTITWLLAKLHWPGEIPPSRISILALVAFALLMTFLERQL